MMKTKKPTADTAAARRTNELGRRLKAVGPTAYGLQPTASSVGRVLLKRLPVKRIKVAKYNPRKDLQPSDPDYQKLKRSIGEFGLVDPLIWNKRSGNLVGGHMRLKILTREFAAKAVDVSVVDLGPAAERTLNLALNKIVGEWDELALVDVLGGLMEDRAADVTLSGFDKDEIKTALALTVAAEVGEEAKGRTRAELPRIEQWGVLVVCTSKTAQRDALKELLGDGYDARAIKI